MALISIAFLLKRTPDLASSCDVIGFEPYDFHTGIDEEVDDVEEEDSIVEEEEEEIPEIKAAEERLNSRIGCTFAPS